MSKTNVAEHVEHSYPALPESEIFSLALLPSLFWRPRFRGNAPTLAHIPFLFWLSSVIKPSRIVVLGAGDGLVHFAFCQAIDKLNLSARCEGYDRWLDESGKSVMTIPPKKLLEHVDYFYDSLSELTVCNPIKNIFSYVDRGSTDLLFIDLERFNSGELPSFSDLFQLVTETGLIVLHGVRGSSYEDEFSVQVIERFGSVRSIELHQGAGLTVIALGDHLPPRLTALFATAQQGRAPVEVETVFRRLGSSLVALERACEAEQKVEKQKKVTRAAQDSRKATEAEITELQHSWAQQMRKMTELKGLVFHLQTEVDELAKKELLSVEKLEAADATIAASKNAQAAMEVAYQQELVAAEQRLEAAGAEADDLRHQLATVETARVAAEVAHELALGEAEQQLESARREADGLRDQLATVEAARGALESTHKEALSELGREKSLLHDKLQSEQEVRFSETAALTKIAENARTEVRNLTTRMVALEAALETAQTHAKQMETRYKAEIANERQTRFKESATLTRMIEDMKTKEEQKKRALEVWLVRKLVRSEKKLKKYRRDRTAFFLDSRSFMVRAYFRLRPHS
ncbi:hypothetical protein [Ruegeria profundi]|uniref:hypothetical protein n=1 Tax=Ruegeria profundi TaxID=1685378 RepID=UPI001CD3D30F|nr:hypothetical protein [Ruegeria profundi]MCA0930416.1 hypothetical protein [Ruegeria profundi]